MAETGETRTYKQLDDASNQVAQFFRSRGLGHDDVVAFMLENTPDYFSLTWGAQRAGLRYVCFSSRLTADETDYILENSGAKLFIVSGSLADATAQLQTSLERYSLGGPVAGYAALESALTPMPTTPVADERAGVDMLYSSGTTGRPKGVRHPLPEDPAIDASNSLTELALTVFRFTPDSIYLSPAPLYHAAPLRFSMTVHKIGGTVVMLKKFDTEGALAAIEKYHVTCSQWVPTHFVRMLKLPEEVRSKYDLSSLNCA
ncbi:MAG: AMP-binding protein, partial [Usitatibacteraceae bacterium]